jgi:NADP-dependent aldehyde dehydrogenase
VVISEREQGYDQGFDPRTGAPVGAPVPHSRPEEVDRVARAAAQAAPALATAPLVRRADLLRATAAALEAARDELVPLADAETALGEGRLAGELTRTTVQLEMFADLVAEGSLVEVVIDHADASARPTPRPDLRRMLVPIGPVAVFAAANFPFAFSVAGGDTASALAAGCPVVVKAHPGHPGLSERTGQIVADALRSAGAPDGSFALVHGVPAGRDLVGHPSIAAVGFTGSLAGGKALLELVNARPDPIPFYGELGSLNPTVVTPAAVAARGEEIVRGFVGSYTMGSGQFCTKPGLLLLPAGHGLSETLARTSAEVALHPLLNARIRDAFAAGAADLVAAPGARVLLANRASNDGASDHSASDLSESTVDSQGYAVAPTLIAVDAGHLLAGGFELRECFGPAAVIVEYGSERELFALLEALPGSLTASMHAQPADEPDLARSLLDALGRRAGRVIVDGWPTGVAVTWAQQHGGPWPAATSVHTSVGMTAVRRFQRPVAYQNVPDDLLPEPLREANPAGLPRRVDGVLPG